MGKTIKILLLVAVIQSYAFALQKVRGKAELIETLSKGKPVVVKLVMQGCGACAMIKDHMEKLQEEYPEVIIVEAVLSENPDLVREESISAAPTILYYKKGASKPHDKVVGANKETIKAKVEELKKEPAKKTVKKQVKDKKEEPKKKEPVKKAKTEPKKDQAKEITNLHGKKDLDNLLKQGKPVVVKAEMTGCGACAMIKGAYENLHKQHKNDVHFAAAELSDNKDLMEEFDIQAFPTFLFFKAGEKQPHHRVRGANEPSLRQGVQELAGKKEVTQPSKPVQQPEKSDKKVVKKTEPKQRPMKKTVKKEPTRKAPVKKPVPLRAQKTKVVSQKHLQEQRQGRGCSTRTCGSCEGCSTC